MKMTNTIGTVLFAAALLVTAAVRAEDPVTISTNGPSIVANRLSLSARFGFNISGNFKGIGNGLLTPPAPNPRGTPSQSGRPNGDPYNYDDGYVLADSSGSADGLTSYWGYDSLGQVSGNTVLLSRSTGISSGSGSGKDQYADPTIGAELVYSRHLGMLGVSERERYGLEFAVNYQNISFSDRSAYPANLTRLTDAYAFEPGTTPPVAPYQGSYTGSGFLLNYLPTGPSVTSVVPGGTVITGNHRFDGDLWGGRFGPYLEFPTTERLKLSLGAGLALGLLDAEVSWSESATLPSGGIVSASGKGNDIDVLYGPYARVDAAYDLGKNWSVLVGVQFQTLGRYNHNFAGREVALDLRSSVFVTVGVGKSF